MRCSDCSARRAQVRRVQPRRAHPDPRVGHQPVRRDEAVHGASHHSLLTRQRPADRANETPETAFVRHDSSGATKAGGLRLDAPMGWHCPHRIHCRRGPALPLHSDSHRCVCSHTIPMILEPPITPLRTGTCPFPICTTTGFAPTPSTRGLAASSAAGATALLRLHGCEHVAERQGEHRRARRKEGLVDLVQPRGMGSLTARGMRRS